MNKLHWVKCARIRVSFDPRIPVLGQNPRFGSYTGKYMLEKTCILAYFTVLYENFIKESCETSSSFSAFASMRLNNFAIENFAKRKTYLCTQYENLALKSRYWKTIYKVSRLENILCSCEHRYKWFWFWNLQKDGHCLQRQKF